MIHNIAPVPPDATKAMEVLDRLRADVLSGKVVAFLAAAVAPDDTALVYSGASRTVHRLRMQGAMAQALHNFMAGDV